MPRIEPDAKTVKANLTNKLVTELSDIKNYILNDLGEQSFIDGQKDLKQILCRLIDEIEQIKSEAL